MSALLGDTPKLVEYGTALMSNLATKEVPILRLLWIKIIVPIEPPEQGGLHILNGWPQVKDLLLEATH